MKSAPWILGLALFAVAAPARSQSPPWYGIIAPSRAMDWSNVGVRGGIPNRTTVCATLNPGASSIQINSAIAACHSGQVVFLNAGTYAGLSGITFNGKSGITLRGAGADQTFLIFNQGINCQGLAADICLGSSDTNWGGGPSNSSNWTAGYTQGTTKITLSSVTNLKVGRPLILDQTDDPSDTGSVFVCMDPATVPSCSLQGNFGNGPRDNRDQIQIVEVVSCGTSHNPGQACNGTNVAIHPGLYMTNWSPSKSPGAWWATSPVSMDGVEDLSIDHTVSVGSRGVEIFNCIDCWVSGIRSVDSGRSHVEMMTSARVTVKESYFYLTQNAVSQSYGVSHYASSDVLIQNNIFQLVTTPVQMLGCEGCVIAYNFGITNYYVGSAGYVMPILSQHSAGNDLILIEGNVGSQSYGDNFHGTHNFITLFRNQLRGNEPSCYNGAPLRFSPCHSNQIAVDIRAYSRFYNVIGNVLGESGTHTTYQGGSKPVFSIGNGNSDGRRTVPSDPLVSATLMRWGNYDVVTGAVRWCGDAADPGWTTICGSTSEVPSGLSQYANAVPATTALPASFYLPKKPGWWPSAKPWPAIGPDVTGGNVPNVGGHAYSIPAQDCYSNIMGGAASGTGSVLSFNASKCYASSLSAFPVPQAGLQTVVP